MTPASRRCFEPKEKQGSLRGCPLPPPDGFRPRCGCPVNHCPGTAHAGRRFSFSGPHLQGTKPEPAHSRRRFPAFGKALPLRRGPKCFHMRGCPRRGLAETRVRQGGRWRRLPELSEGLRHSPHAPSVSPVAEHNPSGTTVGLGLGTPPPLRQRSHTGPPTRDVISVPPSPEGEEAG